MELNKDILRVGQQWERANGTTATVLRVEESGAYIGYPRSGNGFWYRYCDGGKSNIHAAYPQTQLIRLLPDLDETAKAQIDKDEDDATPAEQETETQKQDTEVRGQDVTVFSRFSNSVHNYPQLGYAVVYVNGLQIEVDFDGRELKVQDNSDRHEPLSNL